MDRDGAGAHNRQSPLTARTAGIAALSVSIGVGMASNVLFLAAFQFRLDWFRDPIRILGAGPTSAELLRWAAVLDLIGYYLATGVLAYVLWQWLRPRNPLIADLSALAAGGYVLAGGIGAAALAMVGPMLMHRYTEAAATDQAAIAIQFAALLELVWRAIWQVLDGILVGAWWLGIGLLVRADRPGLSQVVAGPGRSGSDRSRRQHHGAGSRPGRDARHHIRALDGVVDLAPGVAGPFQ